MSEWTEKDFESYTQSDWELIKTVKQLADENLDNVKILTRANDIALAILVCCAYGCAIMEKRVRTASVCRYKNI